jgi:hypothetical protein
VPLADSERYRFFTYCKLVIGARSAKYEFASSNTIRTTFAFDMSFVWKLGPLANERNCFFHRISTVTIEAIEHVLNVANSYLACRRQGLSVKDLSVKRTSMEFVRVIQ